VGCSAQLKGILLSRGRAGIYSTALPAPAVAAAAAALEEATPQLRATLRRRVVAFRDAIRQPADQREWGARPADGACSPIVPIVLGTEGAALEAAARLHDAGYLVPAIRPPTVPHGTARLRVALSAAHTHEEVMAFARALDETGVLRQRDRHAAEA